MRCTKGQNRIATYYLGGQTYFGYSCSYHCFRPLLRVVLTLLSAFLKLKQPITGKCFYDINEIVSYTIFVVEGIGFPFHNLLCTNLSK